MPVITIEMGKAESATKKELIQRLTEVSADITNIPENSFTVLINELKDDNIGIGGKTLGEIKLSHK